MVTLTIFGTNHYFYRIKNKIDVHCQKRIQKNYRKISR